MKKIYLLTLMALTIPFAIAQENIIEFTFLVSKDNTIEPSTIRTTIGSFDQQTGPIFDYSIELSDEDNIEYLSYFPVIFRKTHPPIELNEVLISRKLPYNKNYHKINIYHKESLIFSYDLRYLCNLDNICDKTENYISCPDDCPLDREDGLCIKKEDNICDPDCIEDIDCKKEEEPIPRVQDQQEEETKEEKTNLKTPIIITLSAIILIIVLLTIKYKHKR